MDIRTNWLNKGDLENYFSKDLFCFARFFILIYINSKTCWSLVFRLHLYKKLKMFICKTTSISNSHRGVRLWVKIPQDVRTGSDWVKYKPLHHNWGSNYKFGGGLWCTIEGTRKHVLLCMNFFFVHKKMTMTSMGQLCIKNWRAWKIPSSFFLNGAMYFYRSLPYLLTPGFAVNVKQALYFFQSIDSQNNNELFDCTRQRTWN